MKFGAAILVEGRYFEGCAALINSLARWGFRGTVFVGFRGQPPAWLDPGRTTELVPGLDVFGVPVDFAGSLTWHKGRFILDLWSGPAAEIDVFYYFDCDVFLIGPWGRFETWAAKGIAVCADVNPEMPERHPFRLQWREVFDPEERLPVRADSTYYNAGFFGVPRHLQGFLERWVQFCGVAKREAQARPASFPEGSRHALSVVDQDPFNAALMLGNEPIHAMGRDGMGFQAGGGNYLMTHSVGGRKPWSTCWTCEALRRRGPSLADRAFLDNLERPIRVYPRFGRWRRRLDFSVGRAISALLGR